MKFAALAAALLAAAVPFAVHALTTTQTLPAGEKPVDAAIDTATGRIFVANAGGTRASGGGGFTVIERDGSAAQFSSDQSPAYVSLSATHRRALYSNNSFLGSSITLVNTDTLDQSQLASGFTPQRAIIVDATATAYVLGTGRDGYAGPGSVTEVDLLAGVSRTTAVTGFQPVQMAVMPSLQRGFIAGIGVPGGIALAGTAWIQAYDTSKHAVVGSPTRLPGRQAVAIFAAPDASKLYVIAHIDAQELRYDRYVPSLRAAVFVVDPATLAVTATHLLPDMIVPLSMPATIGIGDFLDWPTHAFSGNAVMDPAGTHLYLLENTNKRLSSLDLATGAVSSVWVDGYTHALEYNAASNTLLASFIDGAYVGVYSTGLERLDSVALGSPVSRRDGDGFFYALVSSPNTADVYATYPKGRALVKVALPSPNEAHAVVNYTDLWWSPGAPGWGLFLDQQGTRVFGTLFTADASGNPAWLVMSEGLRQPDGSFYGTLYRTRGPITPTGANATAVGALRFSPDASGAAVLTYTVDGSLVTSKIERLAFGGAARDCGWTPELAKALGPSSNFTALWSNPAEPGWGVSISHQGDTAFAVSYGYDAQNVATWTVMSNGSRQADGSFAGEVYRVAAGHTQAIGTMALRFGNAAEGTMATAIGGRSESKVISRQVFGMPTSACTN